MEIPNLFKAIVDKGIQTGFFTIDELAILRSDKECWKWLSDYLPIYNRFNPVLKVQDIEEKVK
jgi:hypothetical protein